MSAPFTASASSAQPSSLPSSSSSSPSSNLADSSKVDRTIETLQFDNLVLRTLPIDKEKRNFTREVPDACFSLVEPTPVRNPQLVCVSPDALAWIDLSPTEVSRPDFVEYFSGNKIIPGTRPAAHCYCGHQFGHFSGQLGDGATMYLGEIVTSRGERVELQFKGAGMTPYSRSADGRKVLRSSIREFLCSEGHHYLGIPTTRAGTIVTSDTFVERDLFYDGNVIQERATVITRLAPSFLRFGSFEIAKGVDSITGRSGPSPDRFDIVQKMLDYVIETFYPDVVSQHPPGEERYLAFFDTLTRRTALLVAKWQSVGWAHGVLNTDNMSILGLTIDYGPFGFMDAYDPEYICNGSDHEGRYRFEAQPEICGWNLLKLSQMFESFVPKQKMRDIIGKYEGYYESAFFDIQRKKFGFDIYELGNKSNTATTSSASTLMDEKKQVGQQEENVNLNDNDSAMEGEDDNEGGRYHEVITSFYSTMGETGADFTTSFRCLSSFDPTDANSYDRTLTTLVAHSATVATRLATLAPRIPAQQMAVIMQLMQTSPHIFQQPGMEEQRIAIEEEIERRQKRAELAKQTQAEKEAFDRTVWRKWLDSYQKILIDDISDAESFGNHTPASILADRRRLQNSVNPKYILRNWIAQQVIHAAEKGDYTPMKECLERLRDPYDIEDERVDIEVKHRDAAAEESTQTNDADQQQQQPVTGGTCSINWGGKRPAWADKLRVTCSS